ncbi:hypothetical protein TNCV_4776791 [Trichonephila clavipes]|nr:hypothetical protein TNCV_4776791 [Trichonephila clavipes]
MHGSPIRSIFSTRVGHNQEYNGCKYPSLELIGNRYPPTQVFVKQKHPARYEFFCIHEGSRNSRNPVFDEGRIPSFL